MDIAKINKNRIVSFWQLSKLADEFGKIGIKIQFPKISNRELRKKLIEKKNLNNIQEQWERLKLLKK